jgi:predicted nucleic acid-binding protein
MTKLIVDASVAVRWFVPALAWQSATALLSTDDTFSAPELILAEAANAFWKSSRAGCMMPAEMQRAVTQLPSFFEELAPLRVLADEAVELSLGLNHPVYDCFYLALARRERAPLVTADKRLAAAAQALPDVEVRLLGSL